MINSNTSYGNTECDKSVRASVSIFNCAVVEGYGPVVIQNSQVLRMTLTELWEAQVCPLSHWILFPELIPLRETLWPRR